MGFMLALIQSQVTISSSVSFHRPLLSLSLSLFLSLLLSLPLCLILDTLPPILLNPFPTSTPSTVPFPFLTLSVGLLSLSFGFPLFLSAPLFLFPFFIVHSLPRSTVLLSVSVHRKEVLHTTERAVPALSHPQSEFLAPLPWPRSTSLVPSIYIPVHFVSSRFVGALSPLSSLHSSLFLVLPLPLLFLLLLR